MQIDDKELFRFMQDVRGVLGEIQSDIKSNNSHITAVSANVKEVRKDLSDHKESNDAHGGKAVHQWLGSGAGIVGAIAGLWALFQGKHG